MYCTKIIIPSCLLEQSCHNLVTTLLQPCHHLVHCTQACVSFVTILLQACTTLSFLYGTVCIKVENWYLVVVNYYVPYKVVAILHSYNAFY